MTCPACGFDNLQGVDECENCGADLRAAGTTSRGDVFEAKLVSVPLSEVHPHAALTISTGARAADAVRQMNDARVGCLVVADDGQVRGVVSERDLLMKARGDGDLERLTVSDVMTADPVMLRPDDSVAVAIHKMAVGGFRHMKGSMRRHLKPQLRT